MVNFIKIICIDNTVFDTRLVIGHSYYSLYYEGYKHVELYDNDNKLLGFIPLAEYRENFIEVAKWREQQINEILNG